MGRYTFLWMASIATWGLCVYHAHTRAITYDEATTFLLYLDGSFADVFARYEPNNHLLYSTLAWPVIDILGPDRLVLRLPALVGAAAFVIAAGLTACRVMTGPLAVVGALFLVWNPLTLDFLCAARGYGLAGALLLIAVHQLVSCWEHPAEHLSSRRLAIGGVCIGLMVGANLAFLFPALGLSIALVVLAWIDGRVRDGRNVRTVLRWFVVPATICAAPFLVVVGTLARRADFHFGHNSLGSTVVGLLQHSFHRAEADSPLPLRPPPVEVGAGVLWLAGIATVLTVWVAARALARTSRRGLGKLDTSERLALIAFSGLCATVVGLMLAHRLLDVLYPRDRTGLHLVILFSLALPGAVGSYRGAQRSLGLCGLGVVLIVLSVVTFAGDLGDDFYADWRFDQDSDTMYRFVREHRGADGERAPVVLTVPFIYVRSLQFYAACDDAQWTIDGLPRPGVEYDYIVAHPAFATLPIPEGMEIVFRAPVSGAVVVARIR